VPVAEAEIARARMLELVPGGFEEVDRAGGVELAAYTDRAGETRIRAAFDVVSARPVDRGWEHRWREFHRPVRVGGLWIGPPWEPAPRDELVVVVDPGRAFGTGAHATTRACIELLAGLERGALLDAGCGSGVIAVAAVRLGFGPVLAADLDPIAVEVARDTARRNGVSVSVCETDVVRDDVRPVDIVVANIELAVVEALLARRRARARTIVTSGYLAGERPRAEGWAIARGLELDGWAAHVWIVDDEPNGSL
jgi:ribosomal protein L11 methyltransferase